MKRVALAAVVALVGWMGLWASFGWNAFGVAPGRMWETYQLNGQARLLGGIAADRLDLDVDGALLGRIYPSEAEVPPPGPGSEEALWEATYRLYPVLDSLEEPPFFEPYRAQLGLHQPVYAALASTFGLDDLTQLQRLAAAATAAALVGLGLLYHRLFGALFATLFVAGFAISPMFTTMARNLYWSPVLFFLPALAGAAMQLDPSPRRRPLWLVAAGVATFMKSASTYEYLTTVVLLACAPALVAPLFRGERPQVGRAAAIWLACVAGFLAAFVLHASTRGDTLMAGATSIYVEDIARRTYGDPDGQTGEARESLEASALDVLHIYLRSGYPGSREMGMPGKVFLALIALAAAGVAIQAIRGRRDLALRDAAVLTVFFAVPVSWIVLAKGHSYTQTHINFVLWAFFNGALVFAAISAGSALLGRQLGPSRRSDFEAV